MVSAYGTQLDRVTYCVKIVRASGDLVNCYRAIPLASLFIESLREIEGVLCLKWLYDEGARLVQVVSDRAKYSITSLVYRIARVVLSLVAAVDFVCRWCDQKSLFSIKNLVRVIGSIRVFNVPIGGAIVFAFNTSFQYCNFFLGNSLTVIELGFDLISSGFHIETLARIITGSLRILARATTLVTVELEAPIVALCTIIIAAISLALSYKGDPPAISLQFVSADPSKGYFRLSGTVNVRGVEF